MRGDGTESPASPGRIDFRHQGEGQTGWHVIVKRTVVLDDDRRRIRAIIDGRLA